MALGSLQRSPLCRCVMAICYFVPLLLMAGCSSSADRSAQSGVLISAAASTRDVMEELAADFSDKQQLDVRVNSGASSALARQIIEGAPAHLFLSANRDWAEEVEKEGRAAQIIPLLSSRMVVVAPKGNPAGIDGAADLYSDKVKILALAESQVPAGKYADEVLGKLQLLSSLEASRRIVRASDVRTALRFVQHREADAAIVYATDAKISSDVEVLFAFDERLHSKIEYTLVILTSAKERPGALEFAKFLQSSQAHVRYKQLGFTPLFEPVDAK